ncbi:GNAT family N-acetyltransferase [Candidatus Parcubacteria bacterium]|nr:MAG: GNAT family N-acetyltransferase [Candidatus Parcubacteria bacterium]
MQTIEIRKIKKTDKKYFAKWWRDKDLAKLTSGVLKSINDDDLGNYFSDILNSKKDYHFIITLNNKVIGHISLSKKRIWYETQIIIGDKKYWGKGYGSKAIQLLIKYARELKIHKIFLEVRPDNIRAIRSYEKSGFKRKRTIKRPKNKYLSETLRMEL